MRVLVTGGTSFVGSALARRLRGHEVRVLSRKTGDVRDVDAVCRAVAGCDAVVHAAYARADTEPLEMMDTAILGISNVLRACEKHDVRDLMLVSSPLADDLGVYGTGKRVAELMSQSWLEVGKLDRVVTARVFNAYGPGAGSYHVIPQFILRMLTLSRTCEGVIPFPVRGDAVRSFAYIDDVADQLLGLFSNAGSGVFNVGVDDPRTVTSVAGKIASILGREVNVICDAPPGAPRPAAVMPSVGHVEFDDGLLRTVRWYQLHERDL
jgi:nucleoside-diphosphate-sugar epimerase